MQSRSTRYIAMPLAIILVVGAIGYFAGKPAYRAIKARRAAEAARIATAHFETNGFTEGSKFLRIASTLSPGAPQVVRARAEILTRFHDPSAIQEWYQLDAVQPLSTEERWKLVDLALETDRLDVAGDELKKLGAIHSSEPGYLRRIARYFLSTAQFDDAIESARQLVELDAGNVQYELLLGEALIQSASEAKRGEGRRILLLLAQTDPTVQIPAVSLLIDHASLTTDDRVMVSRMLNSRADLDLAGHILSATLRMTTDRQQRENAAEEVRTHLPLNDEAAAVRFADWCLRFQIPSAAAISLKPFAQSTNGNTATLYVQAVALSEDWPKLDSLLSPTDPRLDPAIIESIRGWRAAKAGKTDDAINLFKVAIGKAGATGGLPSRYHVVAVWAELANLPLVAVDAYAPMLANPRTTVFAARSSLKLLQAQKDLGPSLPDLRKLLDYAPSDGSIQLEFARTAIILNQDIAKAHPMATNLFVQYPKSPSIRLLAAAAETRKGDPIRGVAILEENASTLFELDDRWRSLEVLVLLKGQQKEPARRLARQLRLDQLKFEERAIVESAF